MVGFFVNLLKNLASPSSFLSYMLLYEYIVDKFCYAIIYYYILYMYDLYNMYNY